MWDNRDAFYNVEDENWWHGKARREIIYDCMKNFVPHDVSILEIGAGYGGTTKVLSKFGSVKAVEPCSEAASYLQKRLGIDTYCGTFESFAETKRYDLVACFDVLEHIEDDKQALSKMGTLLNDKGWLVLTVPAYKYLWSRHDVVNYHYRRYNKESLTKIIPSNLIIKRVSYFNTLLFPLALLDKMLISKNGTSYSMSPHKLVNNVLYKVFVAEKNILRYCNLPFGVSILLIAEKSSG